MSQKRARSSSPLSKGSVFRSSPVSDRSSKFIAFYSPTLSAKELQTLPEVGNATHRIAAWKRLSNQQALSSQPVFDIGHDDDGEKYGGKTLSTLLASMEAEGSVVVARWYGGVMLGPVRFDHIRDCARDAISNWMRENERVSKKSRLQEEIKTRDHLARILEERDQSITVLRGLLAEETRSSSLGSVSSDIPARVPQYSNLPLPTLEKLEQVRDATIGWILKQIEKAETAQREDANKKDAAIVPWEPVSPDLLKKDNAAASKGLQTAAPEDHEVSRSEPNLPKLTSR